MKVTRLFQLDRARSGALLARTLLAAMLACPMLPTTAQAASDLPADTWVGTFGRAQAGPPGDADIQTLTDQTLRMIVHTSIGGSRLRVRLSNEFGTTPLKIGAAHVALRQGLGGAQIVSGSDQVLKFNGSPSATIAAGELALSDPIDLPFDALSDLVVSMHLPEATLLSTGNPNALQLCYVSTPGNFVDAANFPTQSTTGFWPFVTGVDVVGKGSAIVALGDAFTGGKGSITDTNYRWPDLLARRLQATTDSDAFYKSLGVVNLGISGNRLLANGAYGALAGRNGLDRFDRDVLGTAGVRHLVVQLGINDILGSGKDESVTASALIGGYRQLIGRAHARGISVFGATLLPFQGFTGESKDFEATRQALNTWIRTGNELDGVIDFDRAVGDPDNPLRLLPAYDSGDHMYPNNRGYEALGNAVPLELFRALREGTGEPLPKAKAARR
ncbi:MAG: family lipase [Massilia sp.]|jgi:lysophospholipase L1-like esterase|nr:family lipase [Massilia sp.]